MADSMITAEQILKLLKDPPDELRTSAGLRKLAWCVETVRANRAPREDRKHPRTTEERAQAAINELRRTIPEIAASYRNPEHADFWSDDEREQFKLFAVQIEDWIGAAPSLWDRRITGGKNWHAVAHWALEFYRREVDEKAGISIAGPPVIFIKGVLRLCGFGEITGDAVEKALRRKAKAIATTNF